MLEKIKALGITGKLTPGNNGENCRFSGKCKNIFGRTIECRCDECDFLMCCMPHACENCGESRRMCPLQKKD